MVNFKKVISTHSFTNSKSAYKKWAEHYDDHEDNLMIKSDHEIFNILISRINIKNKIILDYGCGTGRYWNYLQQKNPQKIIGCDISKEMLNRLKIKFPTSETYLLKNGHLPFLKNNSVDILISTLVIAHLKNIKKIFLNWNNVLKEKSEIVITDFHPALISKGGERTFSHQNKLIRIKNYSYPISMIEKLLKKHGFIIADIIENIIDEKVKSFYERRNALEIYNKFYTTPFIYGIHLKR